MLSHLPLPVRVSLANWQRPSPLTWRALSANRTEAQSLRPAPARPSAGASPPPGQGQDFVALCGTGPEALFHQRAGKRMRFLIRATGRCANTRYRRPQ